MVYVWGKEAVSTPRLTTPHILGGKFKFVVLFWIDDCHVVELLAVVFFLCVWIDDCHPV